MRPFCVRLTLLHKQLSVVQDVQQQQVMLGTCKSAKDSIHHLGHARTHKSMGKGWRPFPHYSLSLLGNINKSQNGIYISITTRIDKRVRRNADIFSAKGEPLGKCDLEYMTIKTNCQPICQKAYRTPLHKRQLVEDSISEMLRDGVIVPSSSPWASPVTLVPKKDNTTRFCIDYRKLNAETVKNRYPLPLIQAIFDEMGGSKVFSTIDLKSGFWQIPVAPEDQAKTAFRCHLGHFECRRMPFGLCNAPAVFQRTMDKVLAGLIGVCAYVYVDDIIIYSKNMNDHETHLQSVFDRLREAGLKLKPTKCVFGLKEVKLFGFILNKEGIKADPEKVQAINEMSPPNSVKDVRRFLGMCSYFRGCLRGYAEKSVPLVELTRKHERFEWTDRR